MTFEPCAPDSWSNWDLSLDFLDCPEFTTADHDEDLQQPDLFSGDPIWSIETGDQSDNLPSGHQYLALSDLPFVKIAEASPSTSATSTATPSSNSSSTDTDPASDKNPSPAPFKAGAKKRGRRPKYVAPEVRAIKREAFLLRNREAASRCRERKKDYTERLRDRMTELQRSRAKLLEERDALMSELQAGKDALLKCGISTLEPPGTAES